MSDADKKALKVKTGVVKRLGRELVMYQEEVQAEQAKVQRLKDQAADPHDIKYAVRGEANRRHTDLILQAGGVWGVASGSHVVLRRAGNTPPPLPQENILAESAAMLPDTRQRLEEAYRELQGLVVRPS